MFEQTQLTKGEISSPAFDLQKLYAYYSGIFKNAVEGKVVARFSPEPTGCMHIGHCKSAMLNYHYAQIYKGQMILRFDDTTPSNEKDQYVEPIIEDLKMLGITYSKVTYKSNYFDQILHMLKQLIMKGLAYVDNTPKDQMIDQRIKKIETATRNFTIEQNLSIFHRILAGEADDYCVRGKINMNSHNGSMRDPVFLKASQIPHQRTGTKYKAYPTYDFACPIVDHIEGVTHVLRTIELSDRTVLYYWILDALGWPKPEIFEYSRLNFEQTCLRQPKLNWFVDTGRVEGWDDPRIPTIRGVLRKGVRVETLTEFMLEQGTSKRITVVCWEKLWALNKRIIDPICPRFSAVTLDKACKLTIINGPYKPEAVEIPKHRLNPDLGTRLLWMSSNLLVNFDDAATVLQVGEKVTLYHWGNVMILSKEIQADGSYHLTAELLPKDKDYKKTKKVTWLSEVSSLLIANLIEYGHLLKKKTVEGGHDFEDAVKDQSKFVTRAYVDTAIRHLKPNTFLQIQPRAYYRIDSGTQKMDDVEFNMILVPDGKTVTLTDNHKDVEKRDMVKNKEDKPKDVSKKREKQGERDQRRGCQTRDNSSYN